MIVKCNVGKLFVVYFFFTHFFETFYKLPINAMY